MIPLDLSTKLDIRISNPIGSWIQIHGIRSRVLFWDPCTCLRLIIISEFEEHWCSLRLLGRILGSRVPVEPLELLQLRRNCTLLQLYAIYSICNVCIECNMHSLNVFFHATWCNTHLVVAGCLVVCCQMETLLCFQWKFEDDECCIRWKFSIVQPGAMHIL